jgi:hypothetical protein
MAMTVTRLSEKFCETIRAAIEGNSAGDDIAWETGLAGTSEGLVFALLIQMPSPVLGQQLQANVIFGQGVATSDGEIADVVTKTLEGLRQARSQVLASRPQPGSMNGSGLSP